MFDEYNWDSFVENVSRGYNYFPCHTPEGAIANYHLTKKSLENVRNRLKNPVNLNGGGPLKPATIHQMEREEKSLIQQVDHYQKFIKKLVKYNLLPTNKLISGEDRKQFVFSLWTMLELPELGKAVYYANRLIDSRYDLIGTPSTDEDYIKWKAEPGRRYYNKKKEEQSRESMYGALINSLDKTIEHVQKERQRLIFSGTPWRSRKTDKESHFEDNQVAATPERSEKQKMPIDEYHRLPLKDILCDAREVLSSDDESIKNALASTIKVHLDRVRQQRKQVTNGEMISSDTEASEGRLNKLDADLKDLHSGIEDLHEMIEAKAEEIAPVCRANLLRGETHTFVNLDLLYRQLEPAVGKLRSNVSWVSRHLTDDSFRSIWLSKEAKSTLKTIRDNHEKVIEATEETINVLNLFKRKGRKKAAFNTTSCGKFEVGYVNVLNGGLYSPPTAGTAHADIMTAEGAAWLKKERAPQPLL
ncbi:MAG: hypothetical protein AB2L12_17565 [Smithellaceae bacterium]